jgi:hypothetical protein
MSELDLDAIRARADAATPGPWAKPFCTDAPGDEGWWINNGRVGTEEYSIGLTMAYNPRAEADATFIAAARADIPALLDEVERLRALLPIVDAARVLAANHKAWGASKRVIPGTPELLAAVERWEADRG